MAAPEPVPLTLANASVPVALMGEPASGALSRVDILIERGEIISVMAAGTGTPVGGEYIDCDGGLVLPCFTDVHTHLDKGHIWPRRPNPDGTFAGALEAVGGDRLANWSAADIERRMDFALRCAFAHGTAAVRTHLDSLPPHDEISWHVFSRMRERWRGRIELQAVALIGPDAMANKAAVRALAARIKPIGGILGGAIAVWSDARQCILNTVEAAGDLALDLDLHCDETLDPASSALRHLADAVIETGFAGRVQAGHCCVLTVQDETTARATIERVAEAGMSIVSLPMCNMYLQDRTPGRTPRYRGATLVNEFRAAGVPVAFASDNTRDPFYAYGDLDMVEVFREASRIVQIDHPQDEAWTWAGAVTAAAAATCGFAQRPVVEAGVPADLIVFRARNWTEMMARPQSDRYVLRGGRPIDTAAPDYRELDDLMGAA